MPPSVLNPQGQGIAEQNLNMPTNQMPEGANVSGIETITPTQNKTDNYTYIPSSEGYKEAGITAEQGAKVAEAMQLADATEADVMKYL